MTSNHRRLGIAGIALAAMTLIAPAAGASTPPEANPLGALCESADGTFFTVWGHHRCFGAQIDGRGRFTAAENLCTRTRGTDFHWARTPDDYYGLDRGNWLCSIG